MSKSGQHGSPNHRRHNPWTFDFDAMDNEVSAINVQSHETFEELPTHRHRQGQLAIVISGAMTCVVQGALWTAPLNGGLWIPGGMPHSNRVSPNGKICFLFVQSDSVDMPKSCCQLAVSPLLRELVLYLASLSKSKQRTIESARLRAVLIDRLASTRTESLYLPISDEPRLRRLMNAMIESPADRSTAAEWSSRLAMSERTLTRLLKLQTGMSFGHWRKRLHLIVALQRLSAGISVQQVSSELGYESVSAFIVMFRKSLGKPPARYFMDQRIT